MCTNAFRSLKEIILPRVQSYISVVLFMILSALPTFCSDTTWDLWLKNEGYYLLSPKEKQKFSQLSDAEKELYVHDLWASLDPDPVTPNNEFQTEYMKRFDYAKKAFRIPSDRAKTYILLGPPNFRKREDSSDDFYPFEVWSYYSLHFKELPPSLNLIFFKRWGGGDYQLYSPFFDGIGALITTRQLDPMSDPMRPSMINQILGDHYDPTLASAVDSLAPGLGKEQSEVVWGVLQAPNAITLMQPDNPNVETTVVYQDFGAQVTTYSVPFEEGVMNTSAALAIPANYLTLEHDKDTYTVHVDLTGSITDAKGNELMRLNDSPALRMKKADFEKAAGYSFSYLFDIFLVPGKYNLYLLFRDHNSNAAGKIEKTFEVQEPPHQIQLTAPLIAFQSLPAVNPNQPFTYNNRQYLPKENRSFNNNQSVIVYADLFNPANVNLEGSWKLEMDLRKESQNTIMMNEDVPVFGNLNLAFERHLDLHNMATGEYQLVMMLTSNHGEYETEVPLYISSVPQVLGRMRIVRPARRSLASYHTNIALQLFYQDKYEEAAKQVQAALSLSPSNYSARSLSARIEKGKGNLDAALAAYQKLLEENPNDAEGFSWVGKWWLEKKDLQKSSAAMKKALHLGYYAPEILNDLGNVELQLGNIKDALSYWEKSLELNSDQPEIAKLVSENRKPDKEK